MGFKGDKEVLEQGTEFIREFKPAALDLLFYDGRYYAAQVMRSTGGKEWEVWYTAVRDELLDRRNKRNKDGVWDDPKSSTDFNTALVLIILQSAK